MLFFSKSLRRRRTPSVPANSPGYCKFNDGPKVQRRMKTRLSLENESFCATSECSILGVKSHILGA